MNVRVVRDLNNKLMGVFYDLEDIVKALNIVEAGHYALVEGMGDMIGVYNKRQELVYKVETAPVGRLL